MGFNLALKGLSNKLRPMAIQCHQKGSLVSASQSLAFLFERFKVDLLSVQRQEKENFKGNLRLLFFEIHFVLTQATLQNVSKNIRAPKSCLTSHKTVTVC
jgi:hypothetical protein